MHQLEAELQARVSSQKAKLRGRQKERYNLAKELGFTGTEAAVLQNWDTEKIKELARSRGMLPPL